jgi:hypothetical protein
MDKNVMCVCIKLSLSTYKAEKSGHFKSFAFFDNMFNMNTKNP